MAATLGVEVKMWFMFWGLLSQTEKLFSFRRGGSCAGRRLPGPGTDNSATLIEMFNRG
jgi:peroxiredoxin family protein